MTSIDLFMFGLKYYMQSRKKIFSGFSGAINLQFLINYSKNLKLHFFAKSPAAVLFFSIPFVSSGKVQFPVGPDMKKWVVISIISFFSAGCQLYQDIPAISYTTSQGMVKGGQICFFLDYQVYFPASGVARFPDGGIPDYAVEKIFLLSYNQTSERLSVIQEINPVKYMLTNVKFFHVDSHEGRFFLSLLYSSEGRHELHRGIFRLDNTGLNFIASGRAAKISPAGQMAYLKEGKVYLRNSDEPLFDHPPIHRFSWQDEKTLLLKPRSGKSDSLLQYTIDDQKLKSAEEKSADLWPETASISETRSYFDGVFYPPSAGLPDPFRFFNSDSDRLFQILIAEEKNQNLKNAILGKIIFENRTGRLKSIEARTKDEYVKEVIRCYRAKKMHEVPVN